MTQDTEDVVADHERIWLQPKCCAGYDGRQWCQDNVFDDGECEDGSKATEYVRADVAQSLSDRIDVLTRALKPFAAMSFKGSIWEGAFEPDASIVHCNVADNRAITLGDFRRARAALHQEGIAP